MQGRSRPARAASADSAALLAYRWRKSHDVNTTGGLVIPPSEAVICVVPAPIPVATPFSSTVATPGALLVQVIGAALESFGVAVSCVVPSTATDGDDGEIMIFAAGTGVLATALALPPPPIPPMLLMLLSPMSVLLLPLLLRLLPLLLPPPQADIDRTSAATKSAQETAFIAERLFESGVIFSTPRGLGVILKPSSRFPRELWQQAHGKAVPDCTVTAESTPARRCSSTGRPAHKNSANGIFHKFSRVNTAIHHKEDASCIRMPKLV